MAEFPCPRCPLRQCSRARTTGAGGRLADANGSRHTVVCCTWCRARHRARRRNWRLLPSIAESTRGRRLRVTACRSARRKKPGQAHREIWSADAKFAIGERPDFPWCGSLKDRPRLSRQPARADFTATATIRAMSRRAIRPSAESPRSSPRQTAMSSRRAPKNRMAPQRLAAEPTSAHATFGPNP